jgi:hypothetical protein
MDNELEIGLNSASLYHEIFPGLCLCYFFWAESGHEQIHFYDPDTLKAWIQQLA